MRLTVSENHQSATLAPRALQVHHPETIWARYGDPPSPQSAPLSKPFRAPNQTLGSQITIFHRTVASRTTGLFHRIHPHVDRPQLYSARTSLIHWTNLRYAWHDTSWISSRLSIQVSLRLESRISEGFSESDRPSAASSLPQRPGLSRSSASLETYPEVNVAPRFRYATPAEVKAAANGE